jgi:FtsP/CotA-like multicopper oxidase with cupredoxin domain
VYNLLLWAPNQWELRTNHVVSFAMGADMRRYGLLLIALLFETALSATAQTTAALSASGRTRTYFIAAEEVNWNYMPRGRNLTGTPQGDPDDASTAAATEVYLKAVYREYTDGTFSALKSRPPEWEHLGILGPLIRAEVGDTIRVYFKNKTNLTCSLHPHGLSYDKSSEGASYSDGTTGDDKKDDLVLPGSSHIYVWRVPERSGPSLMDGSSVLWMYHSHFIEGKDINTGLIGPIIVTARSAAKPDGSPMDLDREFITAFAVFDESDSHYFEANIARQKRPRLMALKRSDPAFRRAYLVYSINGFVEGNLPILTMKKGDRVRWYMFATANEDDIHTPHWHGQTVVSNHMRMDTVQLNPMGMTIADMVADNVGTWLFHCHVNEHFEGGMQALFRVLP